MTPRSSNQARRLAAALAYVGPRQPRIASRSWARPTPSARACPTTRGKGRIFKVFEFLSELQPGGTTDLGDAMKTFVAQHKRRGLAVLISDLYDPAGFERGINTLRFNKFEPFVLHVVDHQRSAPGAERRRAPVRLRNRRRARGHRDRQPARRHGARIRRLQAQHRALLHVAPSAVLRGRRGHSVR